MNPKRKPIPQAVAHQVREQCGQACANPECRKWSTATHELHHINGDRSESTPDNLILLCANCHAQEQQGIISHAKIVMWKQMAVSGYLPPPAIVVADTAKVEQIREAKAKIRDWIDEVKDAHPAYLFQTHESISVKLRTMKNRLTDELPPGNSERFVSACDCFLECSDDEIRPVVTLPPMSGSRSKENQQRELENWHKPGKLLVARLTDILNCI